MEMRNNWEKVIYEGIKVKFPVEPYPQQENLMKEALICFKKGQHGLLESPTGTGKTLAFLCAALSYVESLDINEKENYLCNSYYKLNK